VPIAVVANSMIAVVVLIAVAVYATGLVQNLSKQST
jgi:hypothetical protein